MVDMIDVCTLYVLILYYSLQDSFACDLEDRAARMRQRATEERKKAESENLKLNESFKVTSLFAA